MSSDFSINAGVKPISTEISQDATLRSGEGALAGSVPSQVPSGLLLNTVKDVKIAELQGKKISLGEEQLIKAIEKANKALQGITTTFEFKIHETTKQIMVKVLDKETGETVREIPPEKVLDMVAKLWEKAGILVDERR